MASRLLIDPGRKSTVQSTVQSKYKYGEFHQLRSDVGDGFYLSQTFVHTNM